MLNPSQVPSPSPYSHQAPHCRCLFSTVIGIQACSKYPDEMPIISVVDSKGLVDQMQIQIIEAVEELSSIYCPDGDCPLCLYPLLDEQDENNSLPYMKLMSCFYCFHSECTTDGGIDFRLRNKLIMVIVVVLLHLSGTWKTDEVSHDKQGRCEITEESMGQCPVYRKFFLAKDIECVLDLVGSHSHLDSNGTEVLDEHNLLQSYSEKIRRQKYEAILKLPSKRIVA